MGIDPTAPLTPEASGAPVPGEPPGPGRSRRWILWIAIATLVLGGAIGAGVALLLSGGDEDSRVDVAASTSVATSTSTVPATSAPITTTVRGTASPPETAAPTTTTTEPPVVMPAPPVITQFEVTPTDITCLPGQSVDVTLSWTMGYADWARFDWPDSSVGTRDPSGTVTADIHCLPGETPQDYVFTLTATGPGGTTSRTVTVRVTIT